MIQNELKAILETIKNRFRPRVGAGDGFYYWLLGTVFIVPLLIFNYGYNASAIRQLALLVLVGIGFLIWVWPVVLGKRKIVWQGTAFSVVVLALLAAVLLSSFLGNDVAEIWGWGGGWGESNPWGWIAVLGLGLLITQIPKFQTTKNILISYLLSSTALAIFVLVWWGINQELVMPALTSFAAVSLFFTANAIIITALSLPLRGRMKIAYLAALLIHIMAVFAYDYDVAWYLLGAGMLVLSLLQLIWEKRLSVPSAPSAVDFITPFALLGLSLVLLFAPVSAVSKKSGFDFSTLNSVSANVAYPRFFKYASWDEKLFGAGLGQGAASFWAKAELVDMRQTRQLPALGNGFSAILWDGGLLFILAWLAALAYLATRLWRFAQKATGENLQMVLVGAVSLISVLAAMALLPFDWLTFFGFIILTAITTARLGGPKEVALGASAGQRAFLILGASAVLALTAVVVFFSARQISNRLDFFQSIKVGTAQSGTTVDLARLDKVIKAQSSVYAYRLGRVDLMMQALEEKFAANKGLNPEQAEIKPLLAVLAGDFDYLFGQSLRGPNYWQLGSRAESIGRALPKDGVDPWLKRANGYYEKAIETLPRNVIFLVDVARFYRQNAEVLDGANKDKFYQRAQELTDKALAIDATYQAAYGEKAELLVLLGKSDEALAIMKKLSESSPSAAYSAARLAFSARQYEEAVNYYKKTISQNGNHLQARYELVQAYMALSDFKSAGLELDELDKRAPKDDAATQTLLKGLRELLK